MKRFFSFLCALFVCNVALWAAPVDEEAARKIAADFSANVPSLRSGVQGKAELRTAYVSTRTDGGNRFYVFNKGRNGGFVIVSGDDRSEAVLGYADRGTFCWDSIPPAMRWWLGQYEAELDWLQEHGSDLPQRLPALKADPTKAQTLRVPDGQSSPLRPVTRLTRAADEVPPLLGDIVWGQDEPFNNLCPMLNGNLTVTGCVATAMAQIMAYYKHPACGTGSHSYHWAKGGRDLSADFGATEYAWDDMLPRYVYGGYTQAQADAVATLMYHAGIAVDMNYDPTGSGAYGVDVPKALTEYFGYDASVHIKDRNFYTMTEWHDMVRTELEAGRPVYYAGDAPAGGHAFVCDGYDASGYFHINWGWKGSSNGYFLLNALDPADQGVGGFVGGYNDNQSIIVGIKPDEGGTYTDEEFHLSGNFSVDEDSIGRYNTFTWRTDDGMYNYGWSNLTVSVGMLYLDAAGEVANAQAVIDYTELEPNYGWKAMYRTGNTVPSELADGTYTLCLGFRTQANPEWRPMRVNLTCSGSVTVEIKGDKVYFTEVGSEPEEPVLSLVAGQTVVPATVMQYTDFTVNTLVKNEGTDWSGRLGAYLTDNGGDVVYRSLAASYTVDAKSQQSVSFTGNVGKLPAGTYTLHIGETGRGSDYKEIAFDDGSTHRFTVEANPDGPAKPILTLQGDIMGISDQIYQNEDYTLQVFVRNVGTDYTGNLYLQLLSLDYEVLYGRSVPMTLARDEKKMFEVADWNVGDLPVGNYLLRAAYSENGGQVHMGMEGLSDSYYGLKVVALSKLSMLSEDLYMPEVVVKGREYTVEATLENVGAVDFSGAIYVEWMRMNQDYMITEHLGYSVQRADCTLPVGGRQRISITDVVSDTLPTDAKYTYYLRLVYMDENGRMDAVSGGSLLGTATTVLDVGDLPEVYIQESSMQSPDTVETNTDFTVTATLRNEGTDTYTAQVALLVNNFGSTQYVYFQSDPKPVTVEPGGTAPLQFTGKLPGGIDYPEVCEFSFGVVQDGMVVDYLPWEGGSTSGNRNFLVMVKESGITPDPGAPDVHLVETSTSIPKEIPLAGSFTVSTVVQNDGTAAFVADVAFLLLDRSGQNLFYSSDIKRLDVPAGGSTPLQFTGDLENTVQAGDYSLVFATIEGNEITAYLEFENEFNAYPVQVVGSTPPDPGKVSLTLVEAETTFIAEFAQATDYEMTLTLQNTGSDFNGDVYAVLWDGQSGLYHEQAIPVNVPQGQKKMVKYTWNVPASVPVGRHAFGYAWLGGGYYNFIPFDDGQGTTGVYVDVVANADAPQLRLVTASTNVPSVLYQNTDFTAHAELQNIGKSVFRGEMCFAIVTAQSEILYYTEPFLPVEVPAGASVALDFNGNVGELAAGTYRAGFGWVDGTTLVLVDYEGGGNVTEVEVQHKTETGVPGVDSAAGDLQFYPNPVHDYLVVRSGDALKRVRLHSLAGVLLADEACLDPALHRIDFTRLPAGSYLLSVETAMGIRTAKVMKR